jgi:imidazolonepropionase-like amidohydrolase
MSISAHRLLRATVIVFVTVAPLAAQQPSRSQPIALKNVKLSDKEGAASMTLILRDGRIAGVVDAKEEPPKDVRVIDAHDFFVTPAFIDAYTFAGCVTPQPAIDRDVPPKTGADIVVDMREANRKGIQPSFRAAAAFKFEGGGAKAHREAGFGAIASSPHGQLLSGTSVLATTRDTAARDAFLRSALFDTMGFDATGPGYPGTLMGGIAQLRQFFLDAQRNAEIARRRAAGKSGPRLPFDEDFDAIQLALAKQRRVLCEADTPADIERFVKLGDEFGFEIAISGGREAWKRASLLRDRKIPVFLTLDWGDEPDDPHAKDEKKPKDAAAKPESGAAPKDAAKPDMDATRPNAAQAGVTPNSAAKQGEPKAEPARVDPAKVEAAKTEAAPQDVKAHDPAKPDVSKPDAAQVDTPKKPDDKKAGEKKPSTDPWNYEEPLRAREEKRRLWEETRDGAKVLAEAGVPIAFGTGKSSPKDLVDHVRTLVEHGLAADVALRALTSSAAELCGVARNLGRVEAGFDATLALWSKNPLTSKDAKLGWLVVDGYLFTFDLQDNALVGKPDDGVDSTGTWVLEFEQADTKAATAELKMAKDGKVTGSVRFKSPIDESDLTGDVEGQVAGKKMKLKGRVKIGGFEAEIGIDGELAGDDMKGEARWKFSGGERVSKFSAKRGPKEELR